MKYFTTKPVENTAATASSEVATVSETPVASSGFQQKLFLKNQALKWQDS